MFFTFWLCYQNVGVDLPFFISSLAGSSSWTDTVFPSIFVTSELQKTPTDLMKQPGLLQITTNQRDLLLPAKSNNNNNNNNKQTCIQLYMNYLQLDGAVKLSNLGINSPDVVQSGGGGFWEITDDQTIQGAFVLLSRRVDDWVDSSGSHPCSASSRPLWWCSNAPSMFPNSIKAFPIEVCRFPKTSFLFGNSFSDHPCTVFSTSSAFFRPHFAFPDVNSTLINVQLRILNNEENQPWVQAEIWLTFINVL